MDPTWNILAVIHHPFDLLSQVSKVSKTQVGNMINLNAAPASWIPLLNTTPKSTLSLHFHFYQRVQLEGNLQGLILSIHRVGVLRVGGGEN